jgi:hypothetical protein
MAKDGMLGRPTEKRLEKKIERKTESNQKWQVRKTCRWRVRGKNMDKDGM